MLGARYARINRSPSLNYSIPALAESFTPAAQSSMGFVG